MTSELLDLDGGAGLLELRLDRIGLVLRHTLLDGIGRTVDEILGLLQAEPGDRTDDLDHLDLLVARPLEDDVEGRLLLGGLGAVATRRGCGDRHRSGGRDAPLLLDLVLQLDQLEDRHGPERVEDRVNCGGCHYWSSPSSSVFTWLSDSAAGGSAAASASGSGLSSAAASAGASASAVAASAPELSPCASSCSIRASISPTRFCKGALNSARIVISGAVTAPSTWPRRTSSDGRVARVLTSSAD